MTHQSSSLLKEIEKADNECGQILQGNLLHEYNLKHSLATWENNVGEYIFTNANIHYFKII